MGRANESDDADFDRHSRLIRSLPNRIIPVSEPISGIPESLSRLMAELTKLPGVGARSAERVAFHLLRTSEEEALALADAIRDVKQNLRHCSRCYNLTEDDPCAICCNPQRDQSLIVVVA